MTIEDAIGIATLLPLGSRPEDVRARLKIYQSSRKPRVEMVLNFTRLNGCDDNDAAGARITRKSIHTAPQWVN
jgi:salicylate hydroxylase